MGMQIVIVTGTGRLGVAEASRLAGLGNRFWPGDDRVLNAEGVEEDHVAEAIWLRQADGSVTYAARHMIGRKPALCVQYPFQIDFGA
jgi:NAD(P)-dependent dehydrogenase (short-subunit alcohol dehydrogenase family)